MAETWRTPLTPPTPQKHTRPGTVFPSIENSISFPSDCQQLLPCNSIKMQKHRKKNKKKEKAPQAFANGARNEIINRDEMEGPKWICMYIHDHCEWFSFCLRTVLDSIIVNCDCNHKIFQQNF